MSGRSRPSWALASHAPGDSPGGLEPSSAPRRTSSFKVNVRGQASGSRSTAWRTCARSMPSTRSARCKSPWRSCRLSWSGSAMPLFASTVVTWGGLSLPPSNRPAETTTAGSSRSAIRAPSRASAVGERQMFAVQTTRISIARAYRTGRAGRAVTQLVAPPTETGSVIPAGRCEASDPVRITSAGSRGRDGRRTS
jgi:hypothetical protein